MYAKAEYYHASVLLIVNKRSKDAWSRQPSQSCTLIHFNKRMFSTWTLTHCLSGWLDVCVCVRACVCEQATLSTSWRSSSGLSSASSCCCVWPWPDSSCSRRSTQLSHPVCYYFIFCVFLLLNAALFFSLVKLKGRVVPSTPLRTRSISVLMTVRSIIQKLDYFSYLKLECRTFVTPFC